MNMTTAYVPLVKHERNAGGDLVVTGRATGPDLDLDQQICDESWLARAIPTWFETGANVRENHGPIAAGVGQEITSTPDGGWDLKALVVDPVSARKVERGVLKGYSIGIRNPKVIKDAAAPGGRVVDGQIVEISLCDRPANPTCTLTLAKMAKPGPAPAAEVSKGLVRVEELHDRSGEPLAALKALDTDLGKGDPQQQARDIAGAQQAITTIAALIQSEAECLANGAPSEACDIELLLGAVRSLEWFICREKETIPMAHVELSADADATKTGPAVPPPDGLEKGGKPFPPKKDDEDEDEEDEEGDGKKPFPPKKSKSDDLTELVKAAVAEAVAPLKAELAKAMEAPAPGGPVLTRTVQDTTKAAARETHLAKAAEYERTAYAVTDPKARAGYLQMAAEERAAATS